MSIFAQLVQQPDEDQEARQDQDHRHGSAGSSALQKQGSRYERTCVVIKLVPERPCEQGREDAAPVKPTTILSTDSAR